jgi:hypothetical protein
MNVGQQPDPQAFERGRQSGYWEGGESDADLVAGVSHAVGGRTRRGADARQEQAFNHGTAA